MIFSRRPRFAAGGSGGLPATRLFAASLAGLVAAVAVLPAAAAQAAPVDLSLFVTGQNDQIAAGQTQQVALVIPGISGADPATVKLVVELPEGVTYAGPGRVAGPCEAAPATVTCLLTDPAAIADGQPAWNLDLAFADDLEAGAELPIKGTVSGGGEETGPENNTGTFLVTVIESSDVGITVVDVEGPSGPQNVVKYTYVIHNYGPRALPGVGFADSQTPEQVFGTGGWAPSSVSCIAETSPVVQCGVGRSLAPGQEFRATRTALIRADSPLWGTKIKVRGSVSDTPAGGADTSNNSVTFELDLTRTPGAGSPTTAPTAAPGGGGGLPITGTATLPVAAAGLAILLAGVGAVLMTRRRRAA